MLLHLTDVAAPRTAGPRPRGAGRAPSRLVLLAPLLLLAAACTSDAEADEDPSAALDAVIEGVPAAADSVISESTGTDPNGIPLPTGGVVPFDSDGFGEPAQEQAQTTVDAALDGNEPDDVLVGLRVACFARTLSSAATDPAASIETALAGNPRAEEVRPVATSLSEQLRAQTSAAEWQTQLGALALCRSAQDQSAPTSEAS